MVPALHLNFARWERVAGLMGGRCSEPVARAYTRFSC